MAKFGKKYMEVMYEIEWSGMCDMANRTCINNELEEMGVYLSDKQVEKLIRQYEKER